MERLILQHDWAEAFSSNESAWCTLKRKDGNIHGKITKLYSKEFDISNENNETLEVKYENFKTKFIAPNKKYDALSFRYRYLAISPNQEIVSTFI